jgi:nucleotide-binding universal stress UspA family protein
MYKRVLVPVDFSECSRNALMHALLLRTCFEGQLDVMTAYDVPPYVPPEAMVVMAHVSAPWVELAETSTRQSLAKFVTETARKLGVDRQLVLPGPAASAILGLASQVPYDLIVMGTHGRTGFSHIALGSVAERVVRAAPCPVLTLRSAQSE